MLCLNAYLAISRHPIGLSARERNLLANRSAGVGLKTLRVDSAHVIVSDNTCFQPFNNKKGKKKQFNILVMHVLQICKLLHNVCTQLTYVAVYKQVAKLAKESSKVGSIDKPPST